MMENMIWHNKTRFYLEILNTNVAGQSVSVQLNNIEMFDEGRMREQCEGLIKYIKNLREKSK